MKEKIKLKKAIKDVYSTYGDVYLSTSQLFDIINYEYNFSTGISKNQISSVINKNTEFNKFTDGNDIYYKIKDWIE